MACVKLNSAVAPRRQAPLRKEQVCGRKTLGALVCGKGELRNRALPRAGTLHRRAGREGQLPCPEVAAAQRGCHSPPVRVSSR